MPMEIAEPTAEEMAAAVKLQKQRERKRKNFKRYVVKRQEIMTQENQPQINLQAGGAALEKIEVVS